MVAATGAVMAVEVMEITEDMAMITTATNMEGELKMKFASL